MTEEQEVAVYAAYLGICQLRRCAVKWGQDAEVDKVDKLLEQIGLAFPMIPARVAASVLR